MGSWLSGSVDDEVNVNDDNKLPVYNGRAKVAEALGHQCFYDCDAYLAKLAGPMRHFGATIQRTSHPDVTTRPAQPSGYFYRGSDTMAKLYQPVREEKIWYDTNDDSFDCFLMVVVPRAAVGNYRGPPADNYRFVKMATRKPRIFFSHPLFSIGMSTRWNSTLSIRATTSETNLFMSSLGLTNPTKCWKRSSPGIRQDHSIPSDICRHFLVSVF
jgi:hypothetical protein